MGGSRGGRSRWTLGLLAVSILVVVLGVWAFSALQAGTRPPIRTNWERLEIGELAGWVKISDGDCALVDRGLVVNGARSAFRRFAKAYPDRGHELKLEGVYFYGENNLRSKSGSRLNGLSRHSKRLILFRCGYEMVIEHELLHYHCRELDLPCDCSTIEHPGRVDIRCRPFD
jgi:hypothetical protein